VDDAFDAILRKSLSEYTQKQDAFAEAIAPFSAWHIDEETATLSFTGSDEKTAHYQLIPIGTYLPESQSFAWAWANDTFPESSRRKASQIKGLTARTGYRVFEVPQLPANATDIDELCALALQAFNGTAVFKVKSSIPWVFYSVE
jgi:hypothetical protein